MTRIVLMFLALLAELAAPGAAAQTSTMGRLFFTPAERAQLDAERVAGPAPAVAIAPAAPAATEAAPSEPAVRELTLDGIVKRSSGKSTVWLNHTAQHDGNNHLTVARPATATHPATTALTLQLSSGRKVILKPGQSIDLNTNSIRDVDAP